MKKPEGGRVSSIAEWTHAIYHLDGALPVAYDLLGEVANESESAELSVDDYMKYMESRHVTVTAARDVLRYLESTFAISFSDIGDIALHLANQQ